MIRKHWKNSLTIALNVLYAEKEKYMLPIQDMT